MLKKAIYLAVLLAVFFIEVHAQQTQISGIYPHLAITGSSQTESSIGAVVPWAGKLWFIHYFAGEGNMDGSPHLWTLGTDLSLTPHGTYYGGSIACRLIHDKTGQLMLGPYLIDSSGNIREIRVYPDMGGKHLSTVALDLTNPNRVNIGGLSNERWSADISGSLTPLPVGQLTQQHTINDITQPKYGFSGWHIKGSRCGQGVIIYASNGGGSWPGGAGSLLEWDGIETSPLSNAIPDTVHWKLIKRIQVDEVASRGDIHGAKDPNEPMWVLGWDYRSAVLMVRQYQTGWHTYRLPKGGYTQCSANGYYTEWPRIRDVGLADGTYLMNQNSVMYKLPPAFEPGNTGGIVPLSTFHKMIVDYADWNGRIVMGCNDVSSFDNPNYGRVNSNLLFIEKKDLPSYAQSPGGAGGVWYNESVAANTPSDPFLVSGFEYRVLHLSHTGAQAVTFTLEIDADGSGTWTTFKSVSVPANGYAYEIIPATLTAPWMRVKSSVAATGVSAFFYVDNKKRPLDTALIAGIPKAGQAAGNRSDGVVQTFNSASLPLEFAANILDSTGKILEAGYYQVSPTMVFTKVNNPTLEGALRAKATTQDYQVDNASVIVTEGTSRFRLPRGSTAYDSAGPTGWFRGKREVVTERQVMNVHGTFYELPRGDAGGMRKIRPITTHNRAIYDFCSWRGMLVISGVANNGTPGEHYRVSPDGKVGLWFGNVDDLWKMGPPAGTGGPWYETTVSANTASDPYLMYGYQEKKLTLWHNAQSPVAFTIEVDFLANNSWKTYAGIVVPAGTKITYNFPDGYNAHWVRLKAGAACVASAQFNYAVDSSTVSVNNGWKPSGAVAERETFSVRVFPREVRFTLKNNETVTVDLVSLAGKVLYSRSISRAGTYTVPCTAPGLSLFRVRGAMRKTIKIFTIDR